LPSVRGILALGPRACNRLKQRVTFAIACFGSLAAQQALSRKDAFDFCTQCGHVGACSEPGWRRCSAACGQDVPAQFVKQRLRAIAEKRLMSLRRSVPDRCSVRGRGVLGGKG